MRRFRFNGAAFFKVRVADVPHRFREQIAPLVFWTQQDEIDEAFAHLDDQIRQVALLVLFDVLLDHIV
jgi:hypothetical protein